jgi:enoyl-CoA hydratase
MNLEDYQCIAFERRGRVLVLQLDRPDQLNAVNARLHTELSHVFTDAERDAESDVVVLTGKGKAFCAGGDLDWMQSAIDRPAEFEQTAVEARAIIRSQLDMTKPLVCRLNGHAIGLGATLALCCDMVVAHEGVRIADPHVRVGLVAGDGGALVWPLLMGHVRAKRYLLTGDTLNAAQAERMGLISDLVPIETLDDVAYDLAERLARGATKAIRWTKVTANQPLKQGIEQYLETGVAYEILSNASADHREAVAAFRERRDAVFSGQ